MPQRSPLAIHWGLDPATTFLNHGSFGATPHAVLAVQRALRDRLESQPVRFMVRDLEPLLDAARTALAGLIGADADDLAFLPNATTGVNTALAACSLQAGDELLTTDHEYNACRNALEATARRTGATVVVARVPFPLSAAAEVTEALLARVTPRTRLVLIDHVTSPTGLVLPLAEIIAALRARGIDTLVDGAHTVGMVPLDLASLGATYYTGNLHKWLCAPKGAAFLWVRRDLQSTVRPLVISHGANSPRADRSRFRLEFDWTGTADPTPYLAVPAAIAFMQCVLPGGLEAVMAHNRGLALAARKILCESLGVAPPAPDDMIGSLAAVTLPDGDVAPPRSPFYLDALQEALYARGIEVHAWFNPFRALTNNSQQVAANHVSRSAPNTTKRFGTMTWCDPASADTRARALNVILDVVRRYDIDGVHLDDYFYP
ncbi:MAG: aminotransferase class V-fold PLP-dependent enzyme, partial [Deltaproteobacteria bacterium]